MNDFDFPNLLYVCVGFPLFCALVLIVGEILDRVHKRREP